MIKDDIINFGAFKWRVLDIKDSKALIITEEITELRWYNDHFESGWEFRQVVNIVY